MRLTELVRVMVVSGLISSACGSSNPTNPAPACEPACRDGFVCSRGNCVSACNPGCRSSEVCVPNGSSFTCATLPGDGSVPGDASEDLPSPTELPSPTDVLTPPMDLPPAPDVPPSMDSGPEGDVLTPPTDLAGMGEVPMVGDGGRIPCGLAGQGCCFMRACEAGNECVMNVCRAVTRGMGECGRTMDCPTGQVCGGPTECNEHGCWSCAMPNGAGLAGSVCTNASQCATNACFYGRCTVPCTVGTAGDSECRALGPNRVCTELTFSARMGASRVTLGVCTQSCGRNGDCTSPALCVPLLNYLNDRYDFICTTLQPGSIRTGAAGTACTDGTTCQSALCLPPPRGTGPGACTSFCVTDADCPTAAPMCGPLLLLRLSGSIQMTRGCQARS